MSKINVSVSVDDEHMDRIVDVVQGLHSAGMKVEQIMSTLGVIIGSCESEKMAALSQVEGVSDVEPQQNYQIAPPDSDIQ